MGTMVILKLALLLQIDPFYNPPFRPIWQGGEPVQFCVDGSMEQYRSEVVRAVLLWGVHTGLPLVETRDCMAPRTVAYRLGSCSGGLQAGCTVNPGLFPEPGSGDVYIDYQTPWRLPVYRPFLLDILLHETGHAFGMGESRVEEEVMFPFLGPVHHTDLTEREKKMMRCLYRGMCW